MELLVALGVFVISFLLGSIPWGVIISKVFYHTDIREHGSGNIGTTNAMRTMGKVGGSAMFGGGMSLSGHVIGYDDFVTVAFLGCVWGHIFSPWLGFKGGKGIAVAVGCLFVTFGWQGACLELAIFAVLVLATKYVSVGSIAAAGACPLFAAYYFLYATFAPAAWVCTTVAALTVVWAHRGNIERLRAGNERRIGQKGKEA